MSFRPRDSGSAAPPPQTTAVEFTVKRVAVDDESAATELYIFDCAGQNIFNQVGTNSRNFENASYVVVVYDVSSRESFQSCGRWLQSVRSTRPSSGPAIPGVLIANKADLREGGINARAVVSPEEGKAFAAENAMEYFECSAKKGTGVADPFEYIARDFHRRYEETVRRTEVMVAGL